MLGGGEALAREKQLKLLFQLLVSERQYSAVLVLQHQDSNKGDVKIV